METKAKEGGGLRVRARVRRGGKEGAPKGHRGGSLEEAHTLICHVLVCLRSQKSALQSPVETQATVWFTATARMCDYQWETQEKESSHYSCDNTYCFVCVQNRSSCQYDSIV